MQYKKVATLLTAALAIGVTGSSLAQDQGEGLDQLRVEMAQMRAEMAQLRAEQQGDWMTPERRNEIEGVFSDAFSDAQSRGTLLQEGALAGIDDKGRMFLQSADGTFSARFSGQLQFRYIWNSMTDTAARSDSLSGFQFRRAKFGVEGDIADAWGYKILFATNRSSGPGGGNTFTEDAYITHDFSGDWEDWSVLVGAAKLPFARQELISSSRQVGVDRTLVTEFFTLNRSDQVQLQYGNDDIRAAFAVSDGGNADFTGFAADASNDFAVTGRVDWLAMGDDWGDMKHEFGGVDEDALFFGAALHYEMAEGGGAAPVADGGLAWTLDTLYKTGDVALTAAIFGNHTQNNGAADTDQYGVYVQGDYDLGNDWDIFGRWEYIDDDGVAGAGTDQLQAITVGANHHINSRVKFTGDIVWIYAGDNPTADGNFSNGGELSSGLGLSSTGFGAGTGHDDQIALRLQLQLLF